MLYEFNIIFVVTNNNSYIKAIMQCKMKLIISWVMILLIRNISLYIVNV